MEEIEKIQEGKETFRNSKSYSDEKRHCFYKLRAVYCEK